MPNKSGVVKQFYPNEGKPKIILDDGFTVSAFKAEQMAGVQVGSSVSFAYKTKTVNGKEYNNVDGNVAVVASNAAGSATPNSGAQQGGGRNGMQVGASINQAIAALPLLGTEPSMENIEHLAQGFLLMGDRLAKYQG